MRLFTARRLALAALAPALLLLSVVPGCSNESEGERCGDSGFLNDADCGSGLTCTPGKDLQIEQGALSPQNRCCYTDRVTDSRCTKTGGVSATGSTAGGASGSEAGAPSSEAGSSAATAGAGSTSTELAGAGGA
jgi:hypothetical protein